MPRAQIAVHRRICTESSYYEMSDERQCRKCLLEMASLGDSFVSYLDDSNVYWIANDTILTHPSSHLAYLLHLTYLTETYHMIDTCDPTIACWSDDGETFVVKDPVKFEQQIIPQFFKHSKFSSFVRVSHL
jgi:hypothetical protein